MKKWFVITVIILAFIFANKYSLWTTNSAFAANQTTAETSESRTAAQAACLTTTFASTHATLHSYLIHNWSQVDQVFEPQSDLTKRVNQVKQELNLQNAKYFYNSSKNERYITVSGATPLGSFVTITEASVWSSKASQSTILIVSLDNVSPTIRGFQLEMKQVDTSLTSVHIVPQISACIEGTLNARMSGARIQRFISHTYSVVHARTVEGLFSNLVTSVSAYSPKNPAYIMTNGHKMNLQMAVHYDSIHQRTNVLVGTPIITTTY